MGMKEVYLTEFRKQWKASLKERFQGDLDKLRQVDMAEFAKEMYNQRVVNLALRSAGISLGDIRGVLVEIRNEICKEVTNVP